MVKNSHALSSSYPVGAEDAFSSVAADRDSAAVTERPGQVIERGPDLFGVEL